MCIRDRVDAITHPAVWEAIVAEARGSGAELVVVEAAVMGEEEPDIYDEKWFVWACLLYTSRCV